MPPSILRKTRSLTLTRLAEAVGGHRLSGDSDLDPNEGWGTGSFKKPQKGKLKGSARTVVNAVRFVRALSGVRNAGIHKTSSSSITSPSRTRLAPFPKGPDAASEILERWGGVKKLEQHWVGASGAQYLARCEKKTRWLTEGALMLRDDGMIALSVYREENGRVLTKELKELKKRLENDQNRVTVVKQKGVTAKLKRWSNRAVSLVLSTVMSRCLSAQI
mmetsp:Transcript_44080/g.104945  ORF Transcript_44080/g.104945 Transcript_44080/m.104945 type:complete len:219 (+) Transcript_44080:68-724(+)